MSEEKKRFTNKNSAESFLQRGKRSTDTKALVTAILAGNKVALSQAITQIESQNEAQWHAGHFLLDQLPNAKEPAMIIGITGSPGVGKSSFIEQLGLMLVSQSKKVAVLAIDPSSQVSKGSILGDKTRMERLSHHPLAFIRPSAAGKTLGGVAQSTKSSIALCEKAGYQVILVETVGVGQSEVLVHSMSDMMLLLLQPGSGDELQGIKKGVVELADLLVVNKHDSNKKDLAKQTKRFFANAVHMLSPKHQDWNIKVLLSSAEENTGFEEIWNNIKNFFNIKEASGQLISNRIAQSAQWYDAYTEKTILNVILENKLVSDKNEKFKNQIKNGDIPLYQAVEQFRKFLKSKVIGK